MGQRGVGPGAQTFFNNNSIEEGSKILKITKNKGPKILNCPYITYKKKLKFFFAQGPNNTLSRPWVLVRMWFLVLVQKI